MRMVAACSDTRLNYVVRYPSGSRSAPTRVRYVSLPTLAISLLLMAVKKQLRP